MFGRFRDISASVSTRLLLLDNSAAGSFYPDSLFVRQDARIPRHVFVVYPDAGSMLEREFIAPAFTTDSSKNVRCWAISFSGSLPITLHHRGAKLSAYIYPMKLVSFSSIISFRMLGMLRIDLPRSSTCLFFLWLLEWAFGIQGFCSLLYLTEARQRSLTGLFEKWEE